MSGVRLEEEEEEEGGKGGGCAYPEAHGNCAEVSNPHFETGEGEYSHIGVTPTRGADTPAYSPYSTAIRYQTYNSGEHTSLHVSLTLAKPSRAIVFLTTSMAPV